MTSGLLLSLVAIVWMIVYVAAVATKTTPLVAASTALLLLFGLPLLWLSFSYSAIAARLAADHTVEHRIPAQVVVVLRLATRMEECHRAPKALACERAMAAHPLVTSSAMRDRSQGLGLTAINRRTIAVSGRRAAAPDRPAAEF